MESIPSLEADGSLGAQIGTRMLLVWRPEVDFLVLNGPLLISILSHMNPLHIVHPVYLRLMLLSILASHLLLHSSVFPSCFPPKVLHVLLTPMLAAFHFHLILPDLIILIIFGKKTKTLSFLALVRERTIPTERPPLVGEVSASYCG
jgi:hypothetical protein